MKKVLLASTALAGASLLATSANAGTPIVGDDQEVTISGNVRFSVYAADQDVELSANSSDRGYKFETDESEVKFAARSQADNGLEFGLEIEIQTQPDDTTNTDEAWVFLQFEGAGRVELGDQDGAADRIFVDASDVMAGRGGFDGPIGDFFNFGAGGVTGPGIAFTGDATKITYFTPRFGGFQAGASFTPDTGQNGSETESSNGGDQESAISLGANFKQTFNNVGVTIAATAEFGDDEDGAQEDSEIYGIGANVSFAGFEVGAGYVDRGDTGVAVNGAGDGGSWWDIGASYSTGPWKIGAGAFFSETDTGTNDIEVDIYSVGATFTIADGLALKGDINYASSDNATFTTTDTENEGYFFVLSLEASF